MPKRFMDTGIWQKQWYRRLGPAEKVAWFYLLTNCDAVGVWDADLDAASFYVGQQVDWDALRREANGNIRVLDNGKWWVTDFCKFQYGKKVRPSEDVEHKARRDQTMHDHVYLLLRHHGLWDDYLATVGATPGTGVGVEVEEVNSLKIKTERAPGVMLTDDEHGKLVSKNGSDLTRAAYDKLSTYKLAHGKHYQSDYHAILNWVMDEVKKRSPPGRSPTPGWVCAACGKTNTNTGGLCTCGAVREEQTA